MLHGKQTSTETDPLSLFNHRFKIGKIGATTHRWPSKRSDRVERERDGNDYKCSIIRLLQLSHKQPEPQTRNRRRPNRRQPVVKATYWEFRLLVKLVPTEANTRVGRPTRGVCYLSITLCLGPPQSALVVKRAPLRGRSHICGFFFGDGSRIRGVNVALGQKIMIPIE